MQGVDVLLNRAPLRLLNRVPWTVAAIALLGAACRIGEAGTGGATPGQRPLREEPVSAAQQARAAELLAHARTLFDAGDYSAARGTAEEVVQQHAGTAASAPALWLAAQAAQEEGDYVSAAAMAERYAGLFESDSAAAREALALAARARRNAETRPASSARLILGVIVPQSGSPYLTQYGDLILEGVRLAVEEASAGSGPQIELVVVDDAGDPERDAALTAQLERQGAIGIVGPLLDPGVRAAAGAREDEGLPIVSPTAAELLRGMRNVYSLQIADTQAADTLADYAVQAGLQRLGMLYPRTQAFERRARAFADAVQRSNAVLVTAVPYDSGTTTFGTALEEIARVAPQALYIAATERDVRQIAPQVQYYGLDTLGVRILGGQAWASPEVRRLVEPRFLEGVVAATPLIRSSDATVWPEFVRRYEQSYRRTLSNTFPALGYDATRLILAAVQAGADAPAEVSRHIAGIRELRGATGILSVHEGQIVRRPFLVRVRGGALEPAPPPAQFGAPLLLPADSVRADSMPAGGRPRVRR